MESVWREEEEWRRVRVRETWGEVDGRKAGEDTLYEDGFVSGAKGGAGAGVGVEVGAKVEAGVGVKVEREGTGGGTKFCGGFGCISWGDGEEAAFLSLDGVLNPNEDSQAFAFPFASSPKLCLLGVCVVLGVLAVFRVGFGAGGVEMLVTSSMVESRFGVAPPSD
mmetsp:Transcript_7824/g.14169  ORF Transcript_7824/g.14169 Transcript_7824/m.14169 type:complete len:165 (-) Transcript_7824:291-785(-)